MQNQLSIFINPVISYSHTYKYSNLEIRISELGNDAGIISSAAFSMISTKN